MGLTGKSMTGHEAMAENRRLESMIADRDARIKELEEALQKISGPCSFGWDDTTTCDPQCYSCIASVVLKSTRQRCEVDK